MYSLLILILVETGVVLSLALIAWEDIHRHPICYHCGDNTATTRSLTTGEAFCRKHGTLVPKEKSLTFYEGGEYVTRKYTFFVRAA